MKKLECKDHESIQLSTTPDQEYQWENDKITFIHHKREPRGQPFPSRRPQGKNKLTRTQRHNKLKSEKTLRIHKRNTALERSVKYFTGGLKPVSWRQPHP